MDSSRNTEATGEIKDDLSALAWVQEELRRSLDAAHKALRRFVKEAESLAGSDVDVVDPSVLRTARQQIHQGVGALELVGLPAAATVLRACEAAVQRFVAKPHKLTGPIVDDLEHASFALLDYIARMLSGKQVSPLAMFPQYRKVQEAASADRIHPADLWSVDWRWHDIPATGRVAPRVADDATRAAMEQQMLALMRGPAPAAATRMSDLCEALAAGSAHPQSATLWKLAAAMFEAQAAGLLEPDVFSRRVAARLLAQLRIVERGNSDMSERLAQDLLFFCAQASAPEAGNAPRLSAVRDAYGLAAMAPVDYSTSGLGKYDPAWVAQARKRVAGAKESWSGVAGGEMHRLSGLAEQFSLVGDSLKRLFPHGEAMANELQQAVATTQQDGAAPGTALAMEVATSLLYVEAALEDAEFDTPEQGERVTRLAERIGAVREGAPAAPLEAWMEDLYRRVSDRQTMGSVVQELRASLSEAEKLIDQFFRNPADRNVLIEVPKQLSSMRGVLSVLGMEQASAALLRMRDEVEGLVQTEVDPQRVAQAGVFDRLAGNLGALGFLIDMLCVQPHLAKSLFAYDADTGTLNPVMGRAAQKPAAAEAPMLTLVEPRLVEHAQMLAFSAVRDDVPVEQVARELQKLSHEAQAADQPALAATASQAQEALEHAQGNADELVSVRGQLSEALVDFVQTTSRPMGLDPLPPPPATAPAAVTPPAAATVDLAEDDEMREIFLEEAREVVQGAHAACRDLADTPDDLSHMTTVRRAFHTLKGSSRMVGLKDFGDAAWACEQLYNTRMASQQPADEPLLHFTRWSLDYLGGWVEEIAERRDGGRDPKVVESEALALREPGAVATPVRSAPAAAPAPVAPPAAPEVPALPDVIETIMTEEPLAFGLPPDLPSPTDLDLTPPAATPAETPADTPSFDLDLSHFDAPQPESHTLGVDASASSMNDPFDLAPATQPDVPAAEPAPQAMPAIETIETIDLLDVDLGGASALESLLPSATDATADAALREGVESAAEIPARSDAPLQPGAEDDQVKVVGPLRIPIPLFNIFLNEADELSRRLTTEIAEWAMELHRPVGEMAIALAHSLAGSSATVGNTHLSQLARTLEHALMRTEAIGHGTPEEGRLFVDTSEEIRRLLHQFAAGFLKEPSPELLRRLADHEVTSARRLDAASAETGVADEMLAVDIVVDEAVDVPLPDEAPVAQAVELPGQDSPAAVVDGPSGERKIDTGFGELGAAEFKEFTPLSPEALRAAAAPAHEVEDIDDDIDAVDAVDADLFPIFEEEGQELLPKLESQLRDWARRPSETGHAAACMRTLHTLKGGARLAGAMRLGEMAHRLEAAIEELLRQESPSQADVEALHNRSDALSHTFEALRSRDAAAYAQAIATTEAAASRVGEVETPAAPAAEVPPPHAAIPVLTQAVEASPAEAPPAQSVEAATAQSVEAAQAAETPPVQAVQAPPMQAVEPAQAAEAPPAPVAAAPVHAEPPVLHDAVEPPARPLTPLILPEIDWSRFSGATSTTKQVAADRAAAAQSAVRVRAPLLDRLVNQAGEVSITRSRIEVEVSQIKGSLNDLTDNLERLRQQLRDIELQAETQMSSRLEAAKAAAQSFDPLEFDRFTRFQELTRMMAESVNDVATVQRTLQRTLESTEDELAAQARLTRDLQDDLLRTRMVEFEGLSDRLYRVVRLAAKETGKHVRLDILGGTIEVDRGVLDRMTGAFEHLLRNSVSHGIETPAERTAAGKDTTGSIVVALSHEGNEVGVEFRDDGAGLNLSRIREKGIAMGLIEAGHAYSDAELANLIFHPGFSTADKVTELAGRGIGMDVVRAEVNAMGGRIETATAAGQGTSFKLVLPLTTAVTQVVMLRVGDATVAVPSTLVEIVRRARSDEVLQAYTSGQYTVGDRQLPFFWLGSLLQLSPKSAEASQRTRQVVIIRSAQQRIAIHVDEVLGNQEVVVKNLGPQLSRMPGLAGMTLLASGSVALIYNPVALATLYGSEARAVTLASLDAASPKVSQPVAAVVETARAQAPLVLVVDDSLTVRRVTQRLLVREGYRVSLAKDGLDALERLAEEKPSIVLSDIEMPRMDGFDLVRNIRGDARLRDLPVIMITSRIAQKHRDYAAQLGVDHYLGKPYSEEDLLALVGRYTAVHEAR
jgi:chemosensory pili system protein ChpA (sensor histidine kinase/response regulator)